MRWLDQPLFANFLTSARRSAPLASCAETAAEVPPSCPCRQRPLRHQHAQHRDGPRVEGTSRTLFGEQSEGVIR